VDAALEVAVTGENGGSDDVLLVDSGVNSGGDLTGVTDAGGAAVADGGETDRVLE
jgi:hypothetical protein